MASTSASSPSSVSFASLGSSTPTGTVRFGTVLTPGASASYPSSLFSAAVRNRGGGGSPLSAGAIAGIVVAAVAGLLLAILLVFFLLTWRKRRAAAEKKRKRESRTPILPHAGAAGRDSTSPEGFIGTPEMVQRYPDYAATGSSAAALAIPPAAAAASMQTQPQKKQGLTFGALGGGRSRKGHARVDSAASTTPFLPGSPSSTVGPGRSSASFDYPRYSMDTATLPGTPTSPSQARFSYPRPNTPPSPPRAGFSEHTPSPLRTSQEGTDLEQGRS